MLDLYKKSGIFKVVFTMRRIDRLGDRNQDIAACVRRLEKRRENIWSSCVEKYMFPNESLEATVIVPVFNQERYISQCIDSLLRQKTLYSYEIIVVDDGSTDGTREILETYNDSRLKIIHQNNHGIAQARNQGLIAARGRYILFCDSDDYMPEYALDRLLRIAIRTNADVVEGAYQYVNENGAKGKTKRHLWFQNRYLDTYGVPWGKCIKRALFNNVLFPPGYWFEDSVIHHIILPRAKKIVWIKSISLLLQN